VDGGQISRHFASLIDDRPDDGMFRVDRSIYTDEAVVQAEFDNIFERGWVFLCHDSQVSGHGDYFATEIGRQPVFVTRQGDGSLACFINACTHRGAILTPLKQGNAKVLTCRFHGWSFGCDGHCIRIKEEATGFPEEGFDRGHFDLRPIARLDSYRGFVFGSLGADGPDLATHLGETRPWIDLMVDQALDGLEVVPGSSTYMIGGNWKLQAENGVDGYHVSTVHRVFASTISNRESKDEYTGMKKTEAGRIGGRVNSRGYDLGNGHMAVWAQHTTPEVRPIYEAKERLEKELRPAQVDWILNRGRNLYVFPNIQLMDNPSTQIRVMKPISAQLTEVTVYCIAPKGESERARSARLRKFEDFYLTAGMATSDDIAALEDIQAGSLGRHARWSEFTRGLAHMIHGADDDARALGFEPATTSPNWDHETLFHGLYRRWRDLMCDREAVR
jgi:benzoate/toluate 1,2-dioxygenase alpha subunit